MIEQFCRDQNGFWIGVIAWCANELLEYWLGKTDKTKAGSKVEMLINGVKALFRRKEDDKSI